MEEEERQKKEREEEKLQFENDEFCGAYSTVGECGYNA